jgi:hypothetical protein
MPMGAGPQQVGGNIGGPGLRRVSSIDSRAVAAIGIFQQPSFGRFVIQERLRNLFKQAADGGQLTGFGGESFDIRLETDDTIQQLGVLAAKLIGLALQVRSFGDHLVEISIFLFEPEMFIELTFQFLQLMLDIRVIDAGPIQAFSKTRPGALELVVLPGHFFENGLCGRLSHDLFLLWN